MKIELQAIRVKNACFVIDKARVLREILELAEEDRGSYAIDRLAEIAELARAALAADEMGSGSHGHLAHTDRL
jgi:hypothetical protein